MNSLYAILFKGKSELIYLHSIKCCYFLHSDGCKYCYLTLKIIFNTIHSFSLNKMALLGVLVV